jgi:hypothetical protein
VNVAASVRSRLLNRSRDEGLLYNDLLQSYALERWLYRLSVSDYADRFILKGALMLSVWNLPFTRPTRDIDLLAATDNDPENIRSIISAICQTDVEDDGVRFDLDTITCFPISEDARYSGVRSTFTGYLDTARLPMQVDMGFSDKVTPAPIEISLPTLLPFPPPSLQSYNLESSISEKFEAMVSLGKLNSRLKDFFDIWILSRNHHFQSTLLGMAIRETFSRRGTSLDPHAVCFTADFGESKDKQQQWSAFLRRSKLTEHAPIVVHGCPSPGTRFSLSIQR